MVSPAHGRWVIPQGTATSVLGKWIRGGQEDLPSLSGDLLPAAHQPRCSPASPGWDGHCSALPQDAAGQVHPTMTFPTCTRALPGAEGGSGHGVGTRRGG